jgi:hypothetical protein
MATISKVVRMCLVGAATLLTPVAGTPRIDCLCPDGHVKLFCLGVFFRPGACCGDRCCGAQRSASRSHPRGAACCRHCRNHGQAPPGSRIIGTSCKKTLTEGKVQSVPPVDTAAQDQTAALAQGPAPVAACSGLPGNRPGLLSWHSHDLPPPPDLVIAFQHFVI